MSDDTEEVVKVLFDYNYSSDDNRQIQIQAGEIYRLIEKTTYEWWQVYDPSDADGESFFVPAQYVKIVSEKSPWKALSDLDKLLTFGSDVPNDQKVPGGEYLDNSDVRHSNGSSQAISQENDISNTTDYINLPSVKPKTLDEGDYVNLDQYRDAAGIPALAAEGVSEVSEESDTFITTAPLELIQGTIPPPLPSDGTFVKVITKDQPWDIYKENTLGRLYFVNRETGERAWKPPRKAIPLAEQSQTQVLVSQAPPPQSTEELSELHADYDQVHDNGSVYFIHRSTQDKNRSHSPSSSLNPQRPTNLQASSSSRLSPTLPQENTYEGYLQKTKIVDVSKKKVKKSWTQVYVVLQGSNLVFYKDQKSAAHKQGSPYGKPEGVVSLLGAHVDLNPKEMTSKKNTILLRVSAGNVFLLQSENEKENLEWFTRMKLVANDVSPAEFSPRDFDIPDIKREDRKSEKGMVRSISSDDGASLHSIDKNKNMVGIRAKLYNLISRRPTQEDLYKRGIIKDAVFGSKLNELCDREKVTVPNFVHKCIIAVETKGVTHDGLYRISGNLAEIQRLRCTVDKDDTYNLCDDQWDIHVLTGALKLFFRELKEPVFPFAMYDRFLEAIKKELRKDKLSAFKSAVANLPKYNYATLKELFVHLCKVMDASQKNRMQTQNIAIVFGPTLLWQQSPADSLAVHTVYQSRIVEFILLEYSELFK